MQHTMKTGHIDYRPLKRRENWYNKKLFSFIAPVPVTDPAECVQISKEMLKVLSKPWIPNNGSCCMPTSGYYLGMTCPTCNKPFRMVMIDPYKEACETKKALMEKEVDVYELLAEKCGLKETRVPGSYIDDTGTYYRLTKFGFQRS